MAQHWKDHRSTSSWAFVKPDGHILVDSSFTDEAHAWQVGLGWPSEEEIADAKKRGFRVIQVTVIT